MKLEMFKLRTFLVACVLVCGATAFIGTIVAFAVGIYRATLVDPGPTVYLNFRGDGEPYLTRYNFSQHYRTTTDLDGKPISLDNDTEFAREARLAAGLPPADPGAAPAVDVADHRVHGQPAAAKLLVLDPRRAGRRPRLFRRLLGGEPRTRRIHRHGRLSRGPSSPAEQFSVRGGRDWEDSQIASMSGTYNQARSPLGFNTGNGPEALLPWAVYLSQGSKVSEVNLATREVRSVLADPRSPVVSVSVGGRGGNTVQRDWLAMRTADEVHFFYPGGVKKLVSLPPELRGRDLRMVERPDGDYTVAAVKSRDYAAGRELLEIYVMAPDGTLGTPRETFQSAYFPQDPFFYEAPLVTGSPAMLSASLALFRTRQLMREGRADGLGEALQMAFSEYALYLLITVAAGAALAIACYRRQALYQSTPRQRILWPLFVFLFGVPGWIGYRYCRPWPPLEVCPACHELAPRDDELCAVCGQEFPLPETKGTEIFA